ncbi:hypothetical protein OG824_31510 [Streptomyces prunicolor]|uniref:zinc finger domain-containing protein n=1 Tax=Streptomyces prunicolor TaxID=67348 RepID=UPI00224E1F20|nr:hypothetical protein [Streptomyces prunicolor]MCX5239737.1 hypothetical protein [Streptomyces prunicolor]
MTSRAERRHPAIEQRCDWCHAAPGEPCTNRRNDSRREPHPSRHDAWVVAHTDCTACTAQAGSPCAGETGTPMTGVHPGRAQTAVDAYATALEDASRDVKGRPR